MHFLQKSARSIFYNRWSNATTIYCKSDIFSYFTALLLLNRNKKPIELSKNDINLGDAWEKPLYINIEIYEEYFYPGLFLIIRIFCPNLHNYAN